MSRRSRNIKIIMVLLISNLLLTGCGDVESNFNKLLSKTNLARDMALEGTGVKKIGFYDYNKIGVGMQYKMPERRYLVFYYQEGSEGEAIPEAYREVIEAYRAMDGSYRVYVMETTDIKGTTLEFVVREGSEYYLGDRWDDPYSITELPFDARGRGASELGIAPK